jgi:hypothetical protein
MVQLSQKTASKPWHQFWDAGLHLRHTFEPYEHGCRWDGTTSSIIVHEGQPRYAIAEQDEVITTESVLGTHRVKRRWGDVLHPAREPLTALEQIKKTVRASGTQLVQESISEGLHGVTRYEPQADKVMRMHAQAENDRERLCSPSSCCSRARRLSSRTDDLSARQI